MGCFNGVGVGVVLPCLMKLDQAANIFVSHYSGTITNLNFQSANSGIYSLSANSSVPIGGQPSWITWDSANRTIYVSDESNFGTGYEYCSSLLLAGHCTPLLASAMSDYFSTAGWRSLSSINIYPFSKSSKCHPGFLKTKGYYPGPFSSFVSIGWHCMLETDLFRMPASLGTILSMHISIRS
jgi:hypothetical protein